MKRILSFLPKLAVWTAAFLLVVQIVVALTGLPPALVSWMVTADVVLQEEPRYVVVLGGGGIPSESGLIRTYYAAQHGAGLTGATFIVSLPTDHDPETSSVGRMRDELVMRGIDRESILMEYKGKNTYQQARSIRNMLGYRALGEPLLIVTSPYHARRSLLCFRRQGFENVACLAAQSVAAEADMGPATGGRYNIWGTLVYEVWYARELVALAYYRMRGWL
jgi:uncharacterized SAM-binding protein YcdF (DUF218 family)